MPALSKKQQKFMGIVRSIQKGEQPASKFSKDAQDVAKDMKKKDVKKFASTKHKGLPMKKEILGKLKEMIKQELSEYTYGVGDVVKDVNPTCPHYGAQGKVKSVNPRSVVFVVMNKGKNFEPGMELEKSHDQMKKIGESVNELKKSTVDMMDALLKIKNPMPKEIESALIMMAKGYGLDYVKREVKKDAKGFYKNLKQMAAAFPEFRNKPKDYKFESVIQEMISVKSSKEYFDNLDTAINLIVRQANNLKGQLGKHPIKQNVNKLKAVKTMLKRGISPAFYAYEKDRSYSPSFKATDLNYIKKSLQNGKFRRAVSELMRAIDTRSYDSNDFYFLKNDYKKEDKLRQRLVGVLKDLVNKMENAQLENINEDGHTDVASSKRKVMIMVDDSNKLLNKLNGMNKEDSLPSWWSDKITLSQNYLEKATNYLLNPVESVNENLRPSDKKILMVIATEMVKTHMKGKNKNQIRKELPDILSTMGTNDLSKKSPTNRFNKNKMISLGKGFGKLSDSDKKVFINTLMYNVGLAKSINEKKKMFPPDKMTPKQAKEYKKFIDYAKMGIEYKIDMSLFESINESKEPEVITQLRDIVKRKTNKKIKDPKTKKTMRVDMFTANVVTQVYDAIKKNSSHRQKFESLPLDKMAQLSFKMMK